MDATVGWATVAGVAAPPDAHEADAVFEAVYASHRETLQRQMTALTRDPDAAEEVSQEAFARLLVELRAGRRPDNIGAWLYRVGRNLVVSHARHRQVVERQERGMVAAAPSRPAEAVVIGREEVWSLQEAWGRLEEADRQVLLMAVHGATGNEIARRLRTSSCAARARLCRARQRLRREQALA